MDDDERLMRVALGEARAALQANVFPVGAVLAKGSQILGQARKTMTSNHLGHAEMNLFQTVFEGAYSFDRSDDLALYTTLEPCIMCLGTALHLPVSRLIYAMEDPYGGCGNISFGDMPPRHEGRAMAVKGGLLREEARELFRTFLMRTSEPFWIQGGAPQFQAAVLGTKGLPIELVGETSHRRGLS